MPALREIRAMLADADPADWNRIEGWGAGAAPISYPLMDLADADKYGHVTKWHLRDYSDLLVYRPEVDLSIAYGLHPHPRGEDNERTFDWATSHDWSVELRIADIRWRGQLVDRAYYWVVDGGHGEVPVGDLVHHQNDEIGDDVQETRHVVPIWLDSVTCAISFAHGTLNRHNYYLKATRSTIETATGLASG